MRGAPLIIDLFSGVGGLSLSAVKAGFQLSGAIEVENRILESHKRNFPSSLHLCSDVSVLNSKVIRSTFKLKSREIGGIIGGPPCQGFSSIGHRSVKDKRNLLFSSFFRLVCELQPAFFLAENVPGILDSKFKNIRKRAFQVVSDDYSLLEPIEANAADFGAATTRTRIFFIGVRKDIKGAENLKGAIDKAKDNRQVLVRDALMGLPTKISNDWQTFESSWRTVDSGAETEYLKNLNRYYEGVGHRESIERLAKKSEVSGCFGTNHSTTVIGRLTNLLPGQKDPISKAQRLKFDGFCPTLRAGTDNTKGSYQSVRPIHPTENRVITPREAARLQGFPDWFQFHETKWHSFRQIGNSVCPIAAAKILGAVKNALSM